MDKHFRMVAGTIVTNSKLNKESKLQLLNFIQNEATDVQIKALLLDGEILSDIDEQTEELINKRFENKFLSEVNPEVMSVGIVAAGIAAIAGKMAFNMGRNILNKAHRACRKYTGNEKQKCLAKFKKEAALKQIQVLQSYKSKCNKDKNPKKCIAALDKKIAAAKKKAEAIIP